MIRILTDTGSDIPFLGADALGVEVVELDIQFNDLPYDYRNDPDFSVFFENLTRSKTLPSTSLVAPAQYLDIFNEVKEKGEEMLVITISSKISGTYGSAALALEMCEYDGITVVDSHQCSYTQRMLVERAVTLRNEGRSRADIEATLLDVRDRAVLSCLLDTLKYLKKGGRVPPAMAMIGEMLGIKPAVAMRDGATEPIAKARGFEAGKEVLWNKFKTDGYDETWPVYIGYSQNKARGEAFLQETKDKFGLKDCRLIPVGGVIGTHAGPNAVGLGYMKKK